MSQRDRGGQGWRRMEGVGGGGVDGGGGGSGWMFIIQNSRLSSARGGYRGQQRLKEEVSSVF